MEVLLLVIALGLMALIAMSQCAHHSSRRNEKLYPPSAHRTGDKAQTLPVGSERLPDTAVAAVVPDRERISGVGGRR
jgi:hypothetical protein